MLWLHCFKPSWKRNISFQAILIMQKRVSYLKGLWGAEAVGRMLERQ